MKNRCNTCIVFVVFVIQLIWHCFTLLFLFSLSVAVCSIIPDRLCGSVWVACATQPQFNVAVMSTCLLLLFTHIHTKSAAQQIHAHSVRLPYLKCLPSVCSKRSLRQCGTYFLVCFIFDAIRWVWMIARSFGKSQSINKQDHRDGMSSNRISDIYSLNFEWDEH